MSNDTFQSMIDTAQEAFAPIGKYQEFTAKAVEKVARKQWEVAQACLELGIEQLHAGTRSKDVQSLLNAQQELASRWTDTVTRGSMELMEIVRENQSEAVELASRQAKETTEKATRAASPASAKKTAAA